MCSSTIDAHGSANSGGKIPLLRIVKTTRMERFSWLVMGVIVLATGVISLTDQTQRSSTAGLVLLWILVLSGIKMTILGAVGRHPLPRWLNVLVRSPRNRTTVVETERSAGHAGRRGLGLSVADHARHHQFRIVERRTIGVHQRIAELAALMDRSRCLGRDVAGNATGK